ncbi:MAG: Peptidylprolyl isomerase [Chitinophagaceae bacterium]|nr:Peptidylprolyl isomerase [Chitinophagaceae bacterium]
MGITDKLFQLKNEKATANLKAGEDFLEVNKNKPGIIALPSGLQYEVITEGTGAKPNANNKVTCHYHGTLIDGTVFDSSVQRGQPATFPLNAVIKGWTEGVQLMPLGSKWRFFIPPHLGYGDRQVSGTIGPNSTLIFEVELLSIS